MKGRKQWRHWALAGVAAVAFAGNAYGGYGGLVLNPAGPLTFAATANGSTSAAQTVTVSSGYGGSFTINSIAFTGPFVRNGGTCPASGAVMTNCTIGISFAPNTGGLGGTFTGSMVVGSSVGTGTIALSGQGTPVSNVPALDKLGLIALGLGLFGLALLRTRNG